MSAGTPYPFLLVENPAFSGGPIPKAKADPLDPLAPLDSGGGLGWLSAQSAAAAPRGFVRNRQRLGRLGAAPSRRSEEVCSTWCLCQENQLAVVVKTVLVDPILGFSVHPPMLGPIIVGIEMFTGHGILTHGQLVGIQGEDSPVLSTLTKLFDMSPHIPAPSVSALVRLSNSFFLPPPPFFHGGHRGFMSTNPWEVILSLDSQLLKGNRWLKLVFVFALVGFKGIHQLDLLCSGDLSK